VVNRAPVLTLWAAVVAEVLGFEHDEVLTLGRAVAGLNAYFKGVSLGLFQPTPREVKEQRGRMRKEEMVTIDLLHRAVPAKHTGEGLRALSGDSRCGQGVVDVTEVSHVCKGGRWFKRKYLLTMDLERYSFGSCQDSRDWMRLGPCIM
jgi:hypothetical protein